MESQKVNESIETPQFVVWAIGSVDGDDFGFDFCNVRAQSGNAPDSIWRFLRTLDEFTKAEQDQRIFEGICFQNRPNQIGDEDDGEFLAQKGFRVEEVMPLFGGETQVRQACSQCLANTWLPFYDKGLCGCCGMIAEHPVETEWTESFTATKSGCSLQRKVDTLAETIGEVFWQAFPRTKSAWHSMWMCDCFNTKQIQVAHEVFSRITDERNSICTSIRNFVQALSQCQQNPTLSLKVKLIPRGIKFPNEWRILPFCSRCKATGQDPEVAKNSDIKHHHCETCGHIGLCHPAIKRKPRGDRPYWELVRLLGKNDTIELIRRYKRTFYELKGLDE